MISLSWDILHWEEKYYGELCPGISIHMTKTQMESLLKWSDYTYSEDERNNPVPEEIRTIMNDPEIVPQVKAWDTETLLRCLDNRIDFLQNFDVYFDSELKVYASSIITALQLLAQSVEEDLFDRGLIE